MCFRYSSAVVAPMTWISPRERGGFRMEAASMEPSAEPAPMTVCDLVDEEDVLLGLLELLHDLLHALLELAAVLGAGDEAREVERPDLASAKDVGHVAGGDELGEPLDDRGLAHARVAEDERVVLLAAREDSA